ncbi:MAG: MBL fold metallo-hydrolase [Gemmatimonadetes bacterium]|nr:MAG: MBL fold metallo-hydrolase [Gemmatimonadota bacterium]
MTIEAFAGGAFAENTYLLGREDRGEAVVVDPGAAAEQALRSARERGLEVRAILLTHAHLDHVEGIPAVRAAFPDAPIHLHPGDLVLYDAVQAQAAAFGMQAPRLPPIDAELEHGRRLRLLDLDIDVRFTPGHAPGHVLFHLPGHGVALVGDVVFAGSVGRTDLPGGDWRTLFESIRAHVLTLPDETRLLTGHGPETTVGHERRSNPFLVPHYGGELA